MFFCFFPCWRRCFVSLLLCSLVFLSGAPSEDLLHDSVNLTEQARIVSVNMSEPNLRVSAAARSVKDSVVTHTHTHLTMQ